MEFVPGLAATPGHDHDDPTEDVSPLPLEFFSSPQSIYDELRPRDSLDQPPVLLLRSSWLLARADQLRACKTAEERCRLALPRRQDLLATAPAAFYSVEEVEGLAKNTFKYRPWSTAIMRQMAVVSVSHAWSTAAHPDPEGHTVVALADIIRKAQTKPVRTTDGTEQLLLPADLAVFFDWASLCQRDADGSRSPTEQAAFEAALSRMQLWYAHQMTTVVLMTAAQQLASKAPAYSVRGWPTFEHACSMLGKPGVTRVFWPSLIDASVPGSTCVRRAPLTPEKMGALLTQKTFTNGADRAVVRRLYTATARAVIGGATTLNFSGLGLDNEQLQVLCEWLPQCSSLKELRLSGNRFTDEGVGALVEAVNKEGVLPNLQRLNLLPNSISETGMRTLRGALNEGALPSLTSWEATIGSKQKRAFMGVVR